MIFSNYRVSDDTVIKLCGIATLVDTYDLVVSAKIDGMERSTQFNVDDVDLMDWQVEIRDMWLEGGKGVSLVDGDFASECGDKFNIVYFKLKPNSYYTLSQLRVIK